VVDGSGSSAGEGQGIDDDLVVVPVRLEGGPERLAAGNVLATTGPGAGWFSWRPAAHAMHGGGGGGSHSVAGRRGTAATAFGRQHGSGGAARGSAFGQSRSRPRRRPGLRPWARCRQ
jgi:hypothetical protein